MSVTGSNWGYDKDIAGSLSDIVEHLGKLVNLLESKEERQNIVKEISQSKIDALIILSAGKAIQEILNEPEANLMKKHMQLRKLADELIAQGKEATDGQIDEGGRGRPIRTPEA